jgi:hypothetical protein
LTTGAGVGTTGSSQVVTEESNVGTVPQGIVGTVGVGIVGVGIVGVGMVGVGSVGVGMVGVGSVGVVGSLDWAPTILKADNEIAATRTNLAMREA